MTRERPAAARTTVLLGLALAILASACIATPSPFQKQADDAASTFLAAATTLRLRHEDRLTRTYVVGAFENYRDLLRGVPEALPKLEGIPARSTLERVLRLHAQAMPALESPCLDERCDWHSQVDALQAAGEAYLSAAGG